MHAACERTSASAARSADVDRLHLGVALDLGRRPVLQHVAVVHHRDPFGDSQGDVEVMLYQPRHVTAI